MQQYAVWYILLQNHSTCFGYPPHPSSGVLKTVTAASGTGHLHSASLQRGQVGTGLATLEGSSGTDLYWSLRLKFLVFLMMGAVDTRNI